MGWASGSQVMEQVIDVVKEEVQDPEVRFRIYKGVIFALENQDWDTQIDCESMDEAYDKALMELHPDWF